MKKKKKKRERERERERERRGAAQTELQDDFRSSSQFETLGRDQERQTRR